MVSLTVEKLYVILNLQWRGGVSERLKEPDLKSGDARPGHRGFKSHSLRQGRRGEMAE